MWFTGTSSGERYTVGQSYSMAGDTYRANSDGTFTNERSGRDTVGSSQSWVEWGGGGSISGNTGSGNSGVSQGGFTGSGPGNAAAAGGSRGAAVPGVGGLPDTTPVWMGGQQLARDTGWSDGQDFEDRWGEWGGGMAGLGVMFADGLAHMGVKTGLVQQHLGKAPDAITSGVIDLAGYLEERRANVISDRATAATLKGLQESRDGSSRGVDQSGFWRDPAAHYRAMGDYP